MLWVLLSILVGLLWVHFLEGEGSGAIVALTATLFSTALGSFVDVARLFAGGVAGVPLFCLTNWLMLTRLLGLVALAVMVHEFSVEFLELIDLFTRRILSPFVHGVYSLSFLGRVAYEPAAVIWNIWLAVTKTVTYGSVGLLTKCSIDLVVDVVKGSLEIFMITARAFFKWLGAEGGGTLLTNDFPWVPVFEGVQNLILASTQVFECACAEVSNVYRVPVAMLTAPAAPRALSHSLNVPLSLLQQLLDALRFESYPTFKKTFYHLSGAIHEGGRWLDQALLGGASVLLSDVLRLDPIAPEVRPAKFVGSFFAALAQTTLQAFYVLSRTTVHFALPLLLSDASYVYSVVSPREVSLWLREAVNAGTLSMYWLLEFAYARAAGGPLPTPRLDCTFEPAFYGDRFFQSLFCAARRIGRAATTGLAIASTLPVEMTIMSLLSQERNAWQVAQRFQGPLRFTEPFVDSCEMRKAVAAPTGYDLSTEAVRCDCRDEDALWEVPEFDENVWSSLTGDRSVLCAQPQLEDMLRDVRDASEHFANLVTPFLAPIVRVYARTFTNLVSTGVRLALSLSDILNGDFFELPLSGTGAYGAREDLAVAKWKAEGNALEDSACPDGFVRETALTNKAGNHPCLELHDVTRLHYARERKFAPEAGLCRNSNSEQRGACLCNPALPMLPDSTCSCNLVFSDDAITHADSYGEARWRHNGFRERGWCGTQILEPVFRAVEEESGDAVLSLVNGLFPGEVDWCATQEYRVTETDISTFTEVEFTDTWLPDRAKWDAGELRDQVEERVRRRQLQRTAAGLQTLAGLEEDELRLEETRHVVEVELGTRALANATNICYDKHVKSSAFRATCLVDEAYKRSETLATWRDTQCVLYGNHEIICSINSVVQEGVRVWVGLSRQIWNTGMAIVTGHPLSAEFDIGNRLCNTQRYFAAQASTFASFLPIKPEARKAIAKFLFYLLEVQVESAYLFNQALIMVDDLVKGLFLKDTTADKAIHEFIENVVMSVFKYWSAILTSMAELIEAYEKGGGELLYSLAEICKLIGFGVKDILLDTFIVYAKLFGNLMRVFSGDTSRIPELLRNLSIAFGHIKSILPRIAMQTVGIILEAMGPLGQFLATLAGSLCWTIEQLFNGISVAINTITLGAAGMEEDNDFSCLKQNFFGADETAGDNVAADPAVNSTLRQRSMQMLPQAIAELGWEGSSFCDGVARGYADLTWRALRPLEKETLLSCLRQRYMGTQIAQQMGILSLQSIVYDWSARLHAVRRLARTVFAFAEGLSPQQTRAYLTPVEYREYLPAVRRGWSLASSTFTPERGVSLVQTFVGEVAEVVKSTGETGALLVHVVRGWSNVSTRAAELWEERNTTAVAYDAFARVGRRFAAGWEKPAPPSTRADAVPQRSVFSHPVIVRARRKLRTVVDHAHGVAHDANAFLLGAAGVSLDVNPCDSAFSVVCLNCKLLDNIVETTVEELVRGALFFRYVYVEVTVKLFVQHVRGRALLLRDGLVNGAKNVFSDMQIARPENVAAQFDRLVRQAGAATAYAAVESAKNVGNAMGVLETAAASTASDAFNRTSPTAASLEALRARGADAYAFGADKNNIADLLRRDREFPQQLARRTFDQRKAIDWNYLLGHFPYVPANTGELADPDVKLTTITLVRAFALYLSTTDESYCPLFGHGLFYSLARPLLSTCDMDNVVYSRDSTQTERMERADEAAWATLYAGVVLVALSMYTGLSFFGILAPLSLTGLWYLWMYKVYGFNVNCGGNLPVQLAADVGAYINRWHPEAVCARFSALSVTPCDPYGDLAFANQTIWRDCAKEDEAVRELGYFYSLAYYTHQWLPDAWTWVRQTQPFRYWLSEIRVLDLIEEDNVPIRENCARLLFLDQVGVVSVGGVLLWLVYTLVLPPLTAMARAAVMLSVQIYGLANLLVISITRSEKTY